MSIIFTLFLNQVRNKRLQKFVQTVSFTPHFISVVVLASITDPRIVNTGKLILLPKKIYFGGYIKSFNYSPLWRGYLNSFIYTLSGTLLSVTVTLCTGYALSRSDMFGRNKLMLLFTFTMFFSVV